MTDKTKQSKTENNSGPKISRRQFTAGAVAVGTAASVGPFYIKNARAAAPLNVGVLLPRSGGQAQIGIDCQRGADAALPILKELGYPEMKFMLGDFETKVDIARTQTAKLIDEGANLIVGCFDSGATMAAAQVCEQRNIPLVVNIAAVPKLTSIGLKWVFRNFPHGPMIVKDAFLNQKALFKMTGATPKTVTLMHVNDTFGSSLAGALFKLAPKFKMPYKIVEKISYDPYGKDLSAEVRKAKGAKADALWVVSRLNDAILMTKEMVKQRFEPMGIMSTGPGWYDQEYLKATGKFGDDVISLVPWHDSNKPLSKTLESYFAKNHPERQVNPNHTYTFEGIMIAADAYRRAGSTNPHALQAALKTTNITNNVTTAERIAFEPNGQNKYVKNSAVQNRGGKNLVILPESAAVAKPIWPMRPWKKRG